MPCRARLIFVRRTTIRGRGSLSLVAVLVTMLMAACGSVPKVTFADDSIDGGTPVEKASRSPPDAGEPEALAPETGGSQFCPDTAPTGGICCGALPCIGCRESHCETCVEKGCG